MQWRHTYKITMRRDCNPVAHRIEENIVISFRVGKDRASEVKKPLTKNSVAEFDLVIMKYHGNLANFKTAISRILSGLGQTEVHKPKFGVAIAMEFDWTIERDSLPQASQVDAERDPDSTLSDVI